MSANVLLHNVAKRRLCAHVQRLSFLKTQRLSSHVDNGEQKREERESSLLCKHSSYYQTRTSRSSHFSYLKTGKKINSSFLSNPTFCIQGNSYSISSRNTLLNISGSESNQEALPTPNTNPSVSPDPRAFQRCRLDYSNMTHDISQRTSTSDFNEALVILNKVTILKNNMGASDITSFLHKLSQIPLKDTAVVRRDPRFSMLLQYSVAIIHTFTPQQLLDILKAFVNLDLPRSHSVLASYEAEFCEQASEMNLHQLLLSADLWRCLVRNVPKYLKKLYDNVSQNLNQMSPPELVQLIYIIGESRGCPETLVKSIESLLMRHLNELKPEELGAVCLGLFKAQTSLSERAVQRLVDRSLVAVKDMSDFGIVNVMKYLRFSYLDHLPWLEAMGVEVPRRAPQMEAQGLMHIILGFSALHYRDDRVLLAVAKQLPNVINQCRSKDAAKMLWAYGSLGFLPSQCPDLYPSLTALLRERQSEFQRFPEHLLTGLLGLAFAGLFPEDLLSLALSEEFVDRACKYQELELNRDLFTLDGTVGLELPESTIPRLSLAVREEVTKQLWDFAQSEICQKLEVLEAESMLQKLLGGEMFVRKHMILPHLRSIDLEVHLDQNDQPVSVTSGSCQRELASQNWEQKPSGITITDDLLAQLTNTQKTQLEPFNKSLQQPVPLRVEPVRESLFSVGIDLTDDLLTLLTNSSKHSPHPKDSRPSVKRLAVQVTNRNHYCYRTKQLLGLHALKRRHLTLAGYRVVELPHWEWFPLLRRSQAEKLAYLHCKIFNYRDC